MPSFLMPNFATWDEERQWAVINLPTGWPNLDRIGFSVDDVTSRHTPVYNCIAYAAKDDTQPWWPVPEWLLQLPGARYYHWPPGLPRNDPATVENFFQAFSLLGYKRCKTGKRELGFEKVAIYVDANEEPKHMARELGDGVWFSKLGDCQDIRHHALDGVETVEYGRARYFMRKRLEGICRWVIIKNRLAKILTVK